MEGKRHYTLKARAEKAAETRRRITEATVALHQEVGPARTTVAEVARRAGVQRLTVYNHFPEDRDLLAACQGHFFGEHPPPDPTDAFGLPDAGDRLLGVLEPLYAWYRETEDMNAHVLRDAETMPALAELLAPFAEQEHQLAAALAAGFDGGPAAHAAVALAIDFWTWRRLTRSGLGDREAAQVMTRLVRAAFERGRVEPAP